MTMTAPEGTPKPRTPKLTIDPQVVRDEVYPADAKLKGIVSSVTDYGVFVELEPGVDGLIHVSEMSWVKKVRTPGDLVKVGENVEAVILGINPGDKRIFLPPPFAMGATEAAER